MMNIRYLIVSFTLSYNFACRTATFKQRIVGNYFIVAADVYSEMMLSYHSETDGSTYSALVAPTVVSFGYNTQYIIIKQHPSGPTYITDSTVSNYFIVPIMSDTSTWEAVNHLYSPLSKMKFDSLRRALKIESI